MKTLTKVFPQCTTTKGLFFIRLQNLCSSSSQNFACDLNLDLTRQIHQLQLSILIYPGTPLLNCFHVLCDGLLSSHCFMISFFGFFFFLSPNSLWKEEIQLLLNSLKAVVEGDLCLVDGDICVSYQGTESQCLPFCFSNSFQKSSSIFLPACQRVGSRWCLRGIHINI